MQDARDMLVSERDRKQALQASFVRQFSDVKERQTHLAAELERLLHDMAKVKPPSALLQSQYQEMLTRDRRYMLDLQHIQEDIKILNKEIKILNQQLKQLEIR